MMAFYKLKNVAVAAVCMISSAAMAAQVSHCGEIDAAARMAKAKSSVNLLSEKRRAGDDYRSQTVFAGRSFELTPGKHNAVVLLDLIPKNEEQHVTWMTLGDSLCDEESVEDMKSLSRIGERLSHDLASAVILIPDGLPRYIAYATTAVQDPHSDYAVQMQRACKAIHVAFVKVAYSLPAGEKDWFTHHVFDPNGCHPIALPEAE